MTFQVGYSYTDPFCALRDYEGSANVDAESEQAAKDTFRKDHGPRYAIDFVIPR